MQMKLAFSIQHFNPQNIPKPRAATSVATRITRERVRNSKKISIVNLIGDKKRTNHVKLGHVHSDVYFHE